MEACENLPVENQLALKQDLFVGSESGLLKGVDCDSGGWRNLNTLSEVTRKNEIVGAYWADASQTKICVGRRCKRVDTYDMTEDMWLVTEQLGEESDDATPLKCLAPVNEQIVTGDSAGLVQLWKNGQQQLSITTGDNLYCMGQRSDDPTIIVTGGKENDAKVWDLNKSESPVFAVKNVRNDWLDLRVPVWVRGVAFIPQSNKFVTCTAYHQVRMYDPSSPQRRPVMDLTYGDLPLVAMAMLPSGQQVIVGNSNGGAALIDLRKGAMVHGYKGSAGAVRCIQCHPNKSTVAMCGLDRYVRVYDIESQAQLHKVYLKSRLNCLLYRDEPFDIQHYNKPTDSDETNEATEDIDDEEDDELWNSIEPVTSSKKKRKTVVTGRKLRSSKRKKSTAGR